MKICFLANELSFRDGWGRHSVSLIEQFCAKGVKCLVLSSEKSGGSELPCVEEHKILPPLFARRTAKAVSLARNWRQVKQLVQSADLVHSLVELYAPLPYLLRIKTPWFVSLCGTYAVHPLIKFPSKLLYRRTFRAARRLVCISRFTQTEVSKRLKSDNTAIINPGVDFKKFQAENSSDNSAILSVGALMPRKGYHISIPAFAEAKKTIPDLKYVIIGNHRNTKYVNYIKSLIKNYNLEESVVFLEKVSEQELIKNYHEAALFLLTSVNIAGAKFEGFGQVHLEASACGKPVIGTTNCGAEDAIKDGSTGFLVPQNDIKKTTEAVVKILRNSELSKKLGENGREHAYQMDWARVADKYLELYRRNLK